MNREVSNLSGLVTIYYNVRRLLWPTTEEALQFVHTELGEVYELLLSRNPGWVRNNPADAPAYSDEALAEELGDAIMMLVVAGLGAGVDPVLALEAKIKRKTNEHLQNRNSSG